MDKSSTQEEFPLVSVIVPIFNAMPFLDQALSSMRNQTYQNTEILCINDGSTDDSLQCIKQHAAQDNRIVVIDKANEGYGATCNKGLLVARGEWVFFLEPDDWVEKSCLTTLVGKAWEYRNASPSVDVVKAGYWRVVVRGGEEVRERCNYLGRIKPVHQPFMVDRAAHLLRHHPSIWSALYRRSFLNENGIRFKEIPGAGWADNPFLIETLCQAKAIVYVDEPLYCYRAEAPDEAKAALARNPFIPFERWHDMMDVLERLGIKKKAILYAQIARGFLYKNQVASAVGIDQPEIKEELIRMFKRMDPELVYKERSVSPEDKLLFAQLLDLPAPKIDKRAYKKYLLSEGLYSMRNIGVANTVKKAFDRNTNKQNLTSFRTQ